MKSWPALRIFLSLALGIWSACSQAWGFLTLPPEPLSFLMLFAVGSFFSLAMLFIAGEFCGAISSVTVVFYRFFVWFWHAKWEKKFWAIHFIFYVLGLMILVMVMAAIAES